MRIFWFILAFLALLSPLSIGSASARSTCAYAALAHEAQDRATIQRLERGWTVAFLRGDSVFERCLLAPTFTEIQRNGVVGNLAFELALANANRGKHLTTGPMPPESILLYNDVAVAYGAVRAKHGGTMRFADYYSWNGQEWRAFFAQQTAY